MAPLGSDLPASQPTKRALVVDTNATSRRFVELALGGESPFTVDTAMDGAAALEFLRTQLVDVVVCDSQLPDMTGIDLYQKLIEQRRLGTTPFVLFSAERSVEHKVAALRAGVDDVVVKPCDRAELAARIDALVARRRRLAAARRGRFLLAGDLTVLSLPDLMGVIELVRRSGRMTIVAPTLEGVLHFEGGRVVHATCGNLAGIDAFHRLFRECEGHFDFAPSAPPEMRTIEASTTTLLLEAARLSDTAERDRPDLGKQQKTIPPPPPESTGTLVHLAPAPGSLTSLSLLPPLEPSAALAAQFDLAIRDPYALAELDVWTESTLAEWTERDGAGERFHVHLLADLAAGVSAMLAMAAPPGERAVLDMLASGTKVVGLSFRLRHGRLLDVLLLDVTTPMANITSLRRTPSVTIVCPPAGTLLSLDPAIRFELEMLLDSARPPLILGVGDATIGQVSAVRSGGSAFASVDADFTDALGALDLRELLLEAILSWARSHV